jgi:hypothetical protein
MGERKYRKKQKQNIETAEMKFLRNVAGSILKIKLETH